MEAPSSPTRPRSGSSPTFVALTNLGSIAVTLAASTGLYFADVIGSKATTKADAQVEIARLQADRDALEIKTNAAAEEFRLRTESVGAQLDSQRAACERLVEQMRSDHGAALDRASDGYNSSLRLIVENLGG